MFPRRRHRQRRRRVVRRYRRSVEHRKLKVSYKEDALKSKCFLSLESDWAQQRRQALHDLTPTDVEENARRYEALIERDTSDDPLTLDELDPLQHELEAILLHNMQMQRRVNVTLIYQSHSIYRSPTFNALSTATIH